MESDRPSDRSTDGLSLRLLGPLTIARDGEPLALPPSRKVRALIAYLSIASRPVMRSQLCELLWDVPNDPRGELRWCLSKVRALLDDAGCSRVVTQGDSLRLDLSGVEVDALQVNAAVQADIATLTVDRLRMLSALFGGDFLQGLEIERSAPYSAWLIGQRRHFRTVQAAVLEHRVRGLDPASDEAIDCLETWQQLAPFDRRVHEGLLDALARRGRLREGEEHLAATARLFEAEGQDWAPIGHAWRAAKARQATVQPSARDGGRTSGSVMPAGTVASIGPVAPVAPMAPVASPAAIAPSVPSGSVTPVLPSVQVMAAPDGAHVPAAPHRASIAVMPFADRSRDPALRGGLADGLAYDVITRLAKLRTLFVIAPGTMFALDARQVGAEDAGRTLNVDYVASGSLHRDGDRASVTVQLVETRTARIVWADVFGAGIDDALTVLDAIGNRIVASIATQIEVAERNRAILKPPNSLDAWEAHHRGLWHMYRFNREDNEQAARFFQTSLRLDPTFSRPYAGLSFTHFQNAFLGWGERDHEIEMAYRIAADGLMADDLDPAAHWAMGRALWLRGRVDESVAELDTSVALSPNFALGHYTLAFIHSQSGDARAAIRASDHSRDLSPFDPLLFGMLASRALALMRLGRHDEAADWAVKAAARPNAHVHILAITAHCLALAERHEEARAIVAAIHARLPGYRTDDLLAAFRIAEDTEALMRRVARRIGLSGPEGDR